MFIGARIVNTLRVPGRPSRVHRERVRARAERESATDQTAGRWAETNQSVLATKPPIWTFHFCAAGFCCCGLTLREVLFNNTARRRAFGRLSTMSGSREEERRKLADIINHWNANRLDLFEISRPTEVGGTVKMQERPWTGWASPGWRVDRNAAIGWHLTYKCWKKNLLWAAWFSRCWVSPDFLWENECQTPLKNLVIFNVTINHTASLAT